MPVGDEKRDAKGDRYANWPVNIYKAPKRAHAAAETTGQSRTQESAKTGEGCCRQRGRNGRTPGTCGRAGSAIQSWRRGKRKLNRSPLLGTTSANNWCFAGAMLWEPNDGRKRRHKRSASR